MKPIKYTKSLFHGILEDDLTVGLSFKFGFLVNWKISHTYNLFLLASIILKIQKKPLSALSSTRNGIYIWHQFNAYFWSNPRINILHLYVTGFTLF